MNNYTIGRKNELLAPAPPMFKVKANPSLFICQITLSLIDTRKTLQDILSFTVHTLDFLTHNHYKYNHIPHYLFFSLALLIRQPIEIDNRNTSKLKSGVQDSVFAH